jgi:low temperature requirement protein LtrA
MARETITAFRTWFWRPPRAHGEVERERSVSFLELLYDLVYVAVIAQATAALAADVSLARFVEFAIVFTLIWIAWVNGTLYLELHGRTDGRTRVFVFIQMAIIAFLAAFANDAAGASGQLFALTYVVFLGVLIWLWNSIRRYDTPQAARVTLQYVIALILSGGAILASAFLEPGVRLWIWAGFGVFWIGVMVLLGMRPRSFSIGVVPTHSMVERFGLFVLICLGELVVQVVEGLSHVQHELLTIATAVMALGIGLGFWWIYFDIVGRRLPRTEGKAIAAWILGHLPITLAIAASGAAMVVIIEHALDPATPEAVAWLLAGSLAVVLVAEVLIIWTLVDATTLKPAYRKLVIGMLVAALASVGIGLVHPAPWLFVATLGTILTVLWFYAVFTFIRADGWPPP